MAASSAGKREMEAKGFCAFCANFAFTIDNVRYNDSAIHIATDTVLSWAMSGVLHGSANSRCTAVGSAYTAAQ
jgi:hypothetical protein